MVNARVWRGLVRQRLWKTAAAAGIAVTGVGAGVAVSGGVAGANPTPAGTAAATWLASQLQGPTADHFDTPTFHPTTPTVGLTADGLFAFAAAGTTSGTTFSPEVAAIATWLSTPTNTFVANYIEKPTPTAPTTLKYVPGAVAKVALAADVAGATPRTFISGTDLVADLEGTIDATGELHGFFSNPTTQALAIIVLEHNDPGYPTLPAAVTFLENQACTTGGYPSTYTFSPCTLAGGDVDTTGAVAQALLYYGTVAGDAGAVLAGEVASTWLDSVKTVSTVGPTQVTWRNHCTFTSFTTTFPSVNSTALAVEGLVPDPRSATAPFATDITGGVSWLEAAQNTTPMTPTAGSLPACTATGPGNVRATTQGVQGLTGTPYTALI
ncbi:MAG TPA: hypothetical protein VHB02_08325 [Acidimicrobiales bacterium]|nr:hypothetical protein [Acidimicrobiales bacterium]